MDFRYRQFTIRQDHAAMKVGTDSDLLGTLAAGGRRILDVGTGTGIITLMLAQRYPEAQLTAVEIDDQAVLDAEYNFLQSPFSSRITLQHLSFQDYLALPSTQNSLFDCVVCNPPYFHQSLECTDLSRNRARHSSSLPFSTLVNGAYRLLTPEGLFSVCIPPEVLDVFTSICLFAGFTQQAIYQIKSVPHKPPKRYVLTFCKGHAVPPLIQTYCMRNTDGTRTPWYLDLMRDFLII